MLYHTLDALPPLVSVCAVSRLLVVEARIESIFMSGSIRSSATKPVAHTAVPYESSHFQSPQQIAMYVAMYIKWWYIHKFSPAFDPVHSSECCLILSFQSQIKVQSTA